MTADICVLVESTYPYVSGGVSNWLHALMSKLPEFTFSVVHIGGRPEPGRQPVFHLPDNVVELRELYIFDPFWAKQRPSGRAPSRHMTPAWEQLRDFHEGLVSGKPHGTTEWMRELGQPEAGGIPSWDLLFAPESWDLLVSLCQQRAPSSPFVNYLWVFRSTHFPLFSLLRSSLPRARVYHAVSSGFNGFAGALAKLRTGAPLILTEHGLSVREREIEISQSEWISRDENTPFDLGHRFDHFQEWWLNMFRFMAKTSYDYADTIITIMGINQGYQVRDGASADKMVIIPNGIDVERFRAPRQRSAEEPRDDQFTVGYVGRVVAVKDIKTYIRAVQIASTVIPRLTAYIVGPATEEPEYLEECKHLVELLGLSDIVHFTGPADVRDYYRKIDVLVLTSLHEAQPLVILEANCAGVPVISTEVGACRELLTGITPEDQALGPSGIITPTLSPQEIAQGIIHLWRDPGLRQRMADAGLARAERFYKEDILYESYRAIYEKYLRMSPVPAEG